MAVILIAGGFISCHRPVDPASLLCRLQVFPEAVVAFVARNFSLETLASSPGPEAGSSFVVPGLFAVVLVLVAALEVSVPAFVAQSSLSAVASALEPEAFSVAPVFAAASRADIAEPPVAACTLALSALSASVAGPVVLVDNSAHPTSAPFPNVDYSATCTNFG